MIEMTDEEREDMTQRITRISLWAYLAAMAVFAFGDFMGVASATMEQGGAGMFISHLVILVVAPAAFVVAYSTYAAPKLHRGINLAVALLHVILSPLPATMFSSAFSGVGLASFFGGIVGLVLCVSGFIALLGVKDEQVTPDRSLLTDWRLPYGTGPAVKDMDFRDREIGTAGQGLGSSGFSEENIDLGVRGEEATASILTDLRARYETLLVGHSLRVNPTTEADLDHLFVIGRTIIIVDSKMWKANCAYTLRYNPVEFNLEVLVRDIFNGQKSTRETSMPWMIDQVRAQFPGYRVRGLICLHGTSPEASESQSASNDLEGGDESSLRIIKADSLYAALEREAREAVLAGEPTDSAMVDRLKMMSK